MSALISTARFGLLLLSAAGVYGTWYMLMNNGTADHMKHIREIGPRLLPGTKEPLKTVFTGIPVIDYQLTVLVTLFWEQVDGSNPSASLFCFHFATQAACGWGLLLLESLRYGNRWRAISFLGVWGFLIQNAAYGVILPVYLTLHLWTSPLTNSKRLSPYLVDSPNTAAIFGSIILGYIVPTIVMAFPAPSAISFDQKQVFIAFWQFFPVWVSLVQAILPYVLPNFEKQHSTKSSTNQQMKTMRVLYIGLLTFAGIGQISTVSLLLVSRFLPGLFAPEFRGVFNPDKVFLPAAISPYTRMPSIGAGVHQLLQYDEYVGSAAMTLWGTVLLANTYRNLKCKQNAASLLVQGTTAMLLTGPLGYTTACLWLRDELVIAGAGEDAKKVN